MAGTATGSGSLRLRLRPTRSLSLRLRQWPGSLNLPLAPHTHTHTGTHLHWHTLKHQHRDCARTSCSDRHESESGNSFQHKRSATRVPIRGDICRQSRALHVRVVVPHAGVDAKKTGISRKGRLPGMPQQDLEVREVFRRRVINCVIGQGAHEAARRRETSDGLSIPEPKPLSPEPSLLTPQELLGELAASPVRLSAAEQSRRWQHPTQQEEQAACFSWPRASEQRERQQSRPKR